MSRRRCIIVGKKNKTKKSKPKDEKFKELLNVIPFPQKPTQLDKDSIKMLHIADEIDAVILKHLGDDMDARDLAGLLAHRLGTLMRHIEEKDREILWHIVKKVLRQQADLDTASDL